MKEFINFFVKNNYRNLSIILLLGTILLISFIRYNLLDVAFERDEGSYAYLGKQVLLGKIPYVDFFERKFPFMFYSYAFLITIFGYSSSDIHLAFLMVNIASIFILYLIISKLFNYFAGAVSAASFGLFSLSIYASGYTAQSEHLVIFLMLASALCYVYFLNNDKNWLLVLSGLFLSIALLIKQNGIFYIGFLLLAILLNPKFKTKEKVTQYIYIFIGGVIPVLFTVIIIWIQGAFEEMLYWTVEASSNYISSTNWSKVIDNVSYMLARISRTHLELWIASGLGLILMAFIKMKWQHKVLAYLFVFFSYAIVFPGLRFFGHYWLFIYPSMAFLVGMLFYGLTKFFPKLFSISISLFLIIVAINLISNRDYYFSDNTYSPVRKTYGSDLFNATKKISDYLNNQMVEEDELLVLGFEPQVYVYTNKQAPVRFHWMKLLVKVQDSTKREAYTDILVEKLYQNPPEYIVYMNKFIDNDYAAFLKNRLNNLFDEYQVVKYVKIGKWAPSEFFNPGDSIFDKSNDNYFKVIKRK